MENTELNAKSQRVLGVQWDPKRYMFQFNIRLNFPQRKRKHRTGPEMQSSKLTTQLAISLTKRMILSQVNGIHDLLGLATSFKLRNFRKLFVGQNK